MALRAGGHYAALPAACGTKGAARRGDIDTNLADDHAAERDAAVAMIRDSASGLVPRDNLVGEPNKGWSVAKAPYESLVARLCRGEPLGADVSMPKVHGLAKGVPGLPG